MNLSSNLRCTAVETIASINEVSPKDLGMDIHHLSRKDLQFLCKKNKIRANMSNQDMTLALIALINLKYVNERAECNKSTKKKNRRKKSISKECEIIKSTQEMEIGEEKESPNEGLKGPNISSDVIFLILSLLPTEAILRLKTVCRDWNQIISDPIFIRVHCSRPGPINSFFIHRSNHGNYMFVEDAQNFQPLPSSPKTPSMITLFLSSGFKATSTSHGLVCFYRFADGAICLANPATCHWALIPSLLSYDDDDDDATDYRYRPPLIIYNPTISLHFKLTIPEFESNYRSLRFHIYSSETSSWTLSSVSSPWDKKIMVCFGIKNRLYGCHQSRIGGGTVCYLGWDGFMCGYEIASDTYWAIPLPFPTHYISSLCRLMSRDGEIYTAEYQTEIVRVRRLDENKCWVFEGQGKTEELKKCQSKLIFRHVSYDAVRKALIVKAYARDSILYAFHLSSSRVEGLRAPVLGHYPHEFLPHANTLAPFHGGKQDTHALHQLLQDAMIDDKYIMPKLESCAGFSFTL